jgi:hypothetical protein
MKIILIILLLFGFFAPQSQREWIMYPNPAKDHITIETVDGVMPKYVKFYDMNGRLVLKVATEGRTLVRIEFHLKPGSYIVNLEDN